MEDVKMKEADEDGGHVVEWRCYGRYFSVFFGMQGVVAMQ
jgi:hypothetical protein